MTDVARMAWFPYPKFQVFPVRILASPQPQYDIEMIEIDNLQGHPQEIISSGGSVLKCIHHKNSWLSSFQLSSGAVSQCLNDSNTKTFSVMPQVYYERRLPVLLLWSDLLL